MKGSTSPPMAAALPLSLLITLRSPAPVIKSSLPCLFSQFSKQWQARTDSVQLSFHPPPPPTCASLDSASTNICCVQPSSGQGGKWVRSNQSHSDCNDFLFPPPPPLCLSLSLYLCLLPGGLLGRMSEICYGAAFVQ